MAHFYGGISGRAGDATRVGTKQSGIGSFVQTHYARVSVNLGHVDDPYHDDESQRDMGSITISGGWSTYYRARTITVNDINLVAHALDLKDPKIEKIWERICDEFDKLDKEAPKALKRQKRKQASAQREEERRQKGQQAILETLSPEENNRLIELSRLEGYTTPAYELEVIPAIPCADSGAAGAMARERMVFTRPKYAQHLTHIVNLTTDEGLPEIRERLSAGV